MNSIFKMHPVYHKHRPRIHKRHVQKGLLIMIVFILILVAIYLLALQFPERYQLPEWMIAGLDSSAPPITY